ncbi:hypothetical protein PIB30_011115 [Stylosanthes scabra]|uniref:Uncharacterized protein n=1 Tax=Stylosanthes scabra TaxID=79078 RepID=A0ABU6Z3E9_9FABA|nr:hypothetical protein [Stylosanthes scabra]
MIISNLSIFGLILALVGRVLLIIGEGLSLYGSVHNIAPTQEFEHACLTSEVFMELPNTRGTFGYVLVELPGATCHLVALFGAKDVSLLSFCYRDGGNDVLSSIFEDARFSKSLLLRDMSKQNKLDRLKNMMADVNKMGPRLFLPALVQVIATAKASGSASKMDAISTSSELLQTKPVPPKVVVPETICLDGEEGVKEDPTADLRQKRWKRDRKDADLTDRVLGFDSAWEHEVHPVEGGLTSSSVRKSLLTIPRSSFSEPAISMRAIPLSASRCCCFFTICYLTLYYSFCFAELCLCLLGLHVGLGSALAAKVKAEKELLATQDQIVMLKAEKDSALAYLPLREKIDNLTYQLSVKEGEQQSALERMS